MAAVAKEAEISSGVSGRSVYWGLAAPFVEFEWEVVSVNWYTVVLPFDLFNDEEIWHREDVS